MSLWCLRRSKIKCFQVTFKRCDRWRKSNGQWYRFPNVWCRHAEGPFTSRCSVCLNSVFPFNHYTSDEEFIGEMYSFCNLTAGSATIDKLKNLSYDPFSYDRKRPIINNCDFDPDVNYFNSQVTGNKCMYFLPGELKELNCTPRQGIFSLLHINAQSLQYKSDMIDDLNRELNCMFDVTTVCETWLNCNNEDLVHILGFNFVSVHRTNGLNQGEEVDDVEEEVWLCYIYKR